MRWFFEDALFENAEQPVLFAVDRCREDIRLVPISNISEACAHERTVACLNASALNLFPDAIKAHSRLSSKSALTILVPYRRPPISGVRDDGEVRSFLASGSIATALAKSRHISPKQLCYLALREALSAQTDLVDISIFPSAALPRPNAEDTSVNVLIPHRGDSEHLKTCLKSIYAQTVNCRISLCFDQTFPTLNGTGLLEDRRHSATIVRPSPAGPFVIRQHLALTSNAKYILFQDSDDFSLKVRVSVLLKEARKHQCDIVGSHELRVDEIEHCVKAFRFPLDVNRALASEASHPQLFSTTLVRSAALRITGGFSTALTFAADTQFLLRAHFFARIRNVDAFLYIRRRRAGSLTTRPDTGAGSREREKLDALWKADFAKVKKGNIKLEKSSLRLFHSSETFFFRDLLTGRLSRVNFGDL